MESENLRAAIAGKTPLDHSANTAMANLLAAHIRKTVGDVRNLTRTTASQGQDSFFRACTLANIQVSSGAFTYDFAIKNAIRQVAKEGLKVQYPTGHVDKLDVAVRRAVLTGVNQSAAELNMMYADEIGADLVEVTAHMGARPSHAVWQGGIYSRSGKNSSYPSFIESTGYGTGDGLCGWNCRHSFHAYYEGSPRTYSREYLENLDKDVYEYRDKTYTNYEAGQKQRAYERAIREEKRYLAGLNAAYKETSDQALKISLRADMESSAVRLKRTEANMKIFCKATNRKVDNVRTQVYAVKDASGKIVGFDKSAAQRARQIAIRHHTDWLKSIGAENSTLNTLEKYYKGKYNNSEEYKRLKVKNKDVKLLDKIKHEYNLSIHEGRQGKHIKGHNNYAGKSYLLEDIDPQALVDQYAGTGNIVRTDSGKWIGKQFFTHNKPIGVYKDAETGMETITSYFSIEYSKEKGTHIVPRLKK